MIVSIGNINQGIKMALSTNPNRTSKIEKAWSREIKLRFGEVNRGMLGIALTSTVHNISAEEQTEITRFMEQFRTITYALLLDENWQNKYQDLAYKQGITRADAELTSSLTAQEIAAVGTLALGADALIATAVHSAELDFLHNRANESLAKWVNQLLLDTRAILHEQIGFVPVDTIHAAITDRINATTSRAEVIDVTEIAQASQRSVLKEVEQLNIIQGEVEFDVIWITVADSRVRHLHAGWHGKEMTNEQASRNITISPWNCRCRVKAVVKNSQSKSQLAMYDEERESLLKSEK